MISKNININSRLTVMQGEIQNEVGYITASVDTNGNNLNFGINIINKQAVADNLDSIKTQYESFLQEFKTVAQENGFKFI